jgi:acyl transferase domain-containing protein/3-hydroxymyristoyl/3-hydroxydecanoyl-(acyl carrier protein) dehydratase
MPTTDRVAIVGMAGRFPGSGADLEQFWKNVAAAKDCSREVPPGRWHLPADRCSDPRIANPDTVYSNRGYYLDPFELDTAGLDLPADLLRELDPLFHLVLDVGRRAWAGANIATVNPRNVGVVLGNICLPTDKSNDLAREILGGPPDRKPPGRTHRWNRHPAGLPAGLLAKALGLGGGTYTLDAACASSLYALKLAADELLAGRADAMLAGGCSRPDCQYTQMGFAQLRALSPSGRCSPFDRAADGLVVGEGAGIFVLKRLTDAVAAGDPIFAVLAGAGLSNDRIGNLLAPAVEGQLRAMRAAYAQAEWRPSDVDLIECHATGTPVGDAIEFESLRQLWAGDTGWSPGQCVIGSVKSTVGHLLTGAGAAATMKVVLGMTAARRPPQANFAEPAAALEYRAGPFRVLAEPDDWHRRGGTRKAAVSGFGFGGVNAHLLWEEYKGQTYGPRAVGPIATAITGSALLSKIRKLQARIQDLTEPDPNDADAAIAIVGLAAHAGELGTLREFQERTLGGEAAGRTSIDELRIPLDRFRIPPKELEELLPQQLLALQMAAAALDDCRGNPIEPDDGDPMTGVFVGLGLDPNTTNFHLRWAAIRAGLDPQPAGPALNANRVMGALGSIAASRIARAFRFGGPSFTVCSEETSAGRAIELAVRALRSRELDRAVVGGVEFASDPRADGPRTNADGAAAIVLKRLATAERDGDRVYAIIRGVGSATGGAPADAAPDAAAYASSLLRACLDGAINPSQVGLLEATGEPAESQALAMLEQQTNRTVPLAIGELSRVVGETGFASAVLRVVRASLALHLRVLPPEPDGTPVRYWLQDRTDGPRRAAVSAVGIDGSATHAILEEYRPVVESIDSDRLQPLGARNEAVFVVDGDSSAALADGLNRLAGRIPDDSPSVEALARDWFRRVPPDSRRKLAVAFTVRSADELREVLPLARRLLDGANELPPIWRDRLFHNPFPLGKGGKVAAVYPGSGNQFAGMGRELGVQWPEILHRQDRENRRLRSQFAPHYFWAPAIPAEAEPRDFLFGQVTLGTLTSDLMTSFGLHFDAMLGQSLGESAGLFGLRVWTDRDEMYDRIRRSTLFTTDLGPPYQSAQDFLGTHVPIDWVVGLTPAAPDDVRPHLRPGLKAYLLIVTSPNECVVGGLREDVEKLSLAMGKPVLPIAGVTLAHCEAGKPVERPYRELHTLPVTVPPRTKFYSGAWGREYRMTTENAADSITAGLVGTIDFPNSIEAAYRDGVRIFLEMGPGASTSRMISATLGERPHVARSVCAPRQDAVSLVLRALAQLVAERVTLSLETLYGGESLCVGHRLKVAETKRELVVPTAAPVLRRKPEPERPRNVPVDEELLPWEPPAAPVVVLEPTAPLTQTPRPAARPAVDWSPFIHAAMAGQRATADAHALFLQLQNALANTSVAALALLQNGGGEGGTGRRDENHGVGVFAPPLHHAPHPPLALNFEQCTAFAVGKIGDVLGPDYAPIDAHPTRVRLPEGPLMLVDRILSIDGEPRSLKSGRCVTDHTVHARRWYLDAGRCPTSITVEAGQADLFLSGYLGIDFVTKGHAVYRLLDAVVTFHRELPRVGDRIEYDIHIDEFFNQADAWLFRFRFEGTIDGKPLLSMKNGVAGFFTQAALEAGQGIVHTKLDRQPIPGKKPADWRDLVPLARCTVSDAGVEALRAGDYAAAFGPTFANLALRHPLRLPGGMLRLVDRVVELDPTGGRFGTGFIRAEYDLRPKEWFIECHFVDDKVMPGTLMYECCLHTLRILLARIGWIGEEGEVVCEPVPGVDSRLKCRGQVLETTKRVTYEISVRELGFRNAEFGMKGNGGMPYCIADALMYADGKPIVEITNLSLRMSGLTRETLEQLWSSHRPPHATPHAPKYDSAKILAYSNGNPSEAFGEPYRVFDRERVIARLPGPPYQFLDCIPAVTGEPFVLKAGAACTALYAVPPDAWYFAANRAPTMPFSILLEIALQPCGWLAAYCGSALTSPVDLSFRNLGGQATQFLPVGPDIGTLVTNVTMTNVSRSAGMIIQHYSMNVACDRGTVYEGTTYFGFFTKDALANQVGMPGAKVPFLAPEDRANPDRLPLDAPFPADQLRMVDSIDGFLPRGGRKGLGLIQGSIAVDPSFWFFQAHFYQDPVWPGSLGLESFLQLLKYVAWKKFGPPPSHGWRTVALNRKHEWTYRGQVLPTDRVVTVVLEVTEEDPAGRRLTADGFLVVDGRIIYQMTGFTLE